MVLSEKIKPGMTREEDFPVAEQNAAIHVGSGSSPVLATPWMIAFMERVSHRLLAEHLSPGETSVGIYLEIKHLAPTPVGGTVQVKTQITEILGNQVAFNGAINIDQAAQDKHIPFYGSIFFNIYHTSNYIEVPIKDPTAFKRIA